MRTRFQAIFSTAYHLNGRMRGELAGRLSEAHRILWVKMDCPMKGRRWSSYV